MRACLFFLLLLLVQGGWAADWTWVDVGPPGGAMSDISINPNGNSVLSVSFFCDGYLNQGGPWQRTLSAGPSGDGGFCTFLLPDTAVFVNKENGQLFQTVDGGLNWSTVWTFPDPVLGLSEVKSRVAYVVTNDQMNSVNVLYRSTSAGATWGPLGNLPIYFAQDVAVTAFLDTLIFVGGWAQDSVWVLKSDDGGLSWNTVVQFSSPQEGEVFDLEWDESRKTLWTCLDPGPPSPASLPPVHLYFDSLGLATFLDTLKSAGLYLVADIELLAQDTVLAGGLMGIYSLIRTPEWDSILVGPRLDSSAVVSDIDVESGILWASSDAGCLTSTDGGNTWQHQNDGLDAVTVLSRSQVSEFVDGTLYTGSLGSLMFGPAYRSFDDGATWEWVEHGPPFTGLAELFPGNPDVVYGHGLWITTGYTYHSVARSLDAGASWTWMNSFPPDSVFQEMMMADLWVSPSDSNTLLRIWGAAWQFYPGPVSRSTDGGTTWAEVLLEDVLWMTGGDTVFASWDSTWVSFNAGATWALFSELGGWIDWDENNGYLYLLNLEDSLRLYRYNVAGDSTRILGPLAFPPAPIFPDLSVSPRGHIYVCWFDQSWLPLVARSTDYGSTWETDTLSFLCGMIRACSTAVIVGEIGRGFMRSTDAVGIEESEDAYAARLSFAVSPNPFVNSTSIRYSLPNQGRVRVAVYDLTGRLIQVVEEGRKGRGAHQSSWDGRDATGNAVSSGIYFIRLETASQDPRTISLVKLPN